MKKDSKELQSVQPATMQDEASALIAQAIDKNVPVETMEKLLALHDKIKADKARNEFNHAMASFQAQCPTIEKRKQGFNYKYAPLESIVEQVKELLSRNGFSYTFDTDNVENAVIVYCKVKHVGGHMETSKARIEHETTTKMNSSQQSGASMTYGKRYAFCNAFGILTGDEDTDAQYTSKSNEYKAKPTQISMNTTQEVSMITPEQKSEILDIVYQTGRSRVELDAFIYDAFNGKRLEQLTKEQAYKLIGRLQKEGKKTVTPEAQVTEEDLDMMASAIN